MRRSVKDDETMNEKAHQRDADKRKKKERRQARNSKRYYEDD
jgi:hypothetical protein